MIRAMGMVCALSLSVAMMPTAFCQAAAEKSKLSDPPRKIVVSESISDQNLADLRSAVPTIEFVQVGREDKEGLLKALADADGLIGRPDAEMVRAGKKLRWVQVGSAGVEGYSFPEIVESDIILTNMKIVSGPELADHSMALLLALSRDIDNAVKSMVDAEWRGPKANLQPIVLRGKTALVIGLGGMGTGVAERARAFGMRVIALEPKDVPWINAVEKIGKPDQLHEFLPEADVVFMCAPNTAETTGMIGAEEFARMKQGTYFVSVSRGKNTNTDALVEALKSGKLAGAGLDVVDPEPLPKEHPLWKMDNVIITHHIGSKSDPQGGGGDRQFEIMLDNARRFAAGLPLKNVVDKRKGY